MKFNINLSIDRLCAFRFFFNLAAFDCLLFLKNSTPTENRTRIKGLGNLRSIHLTMGAMCGSFLSWKALQR